MFDFVKVNLNSLNTWKFTSILLVVLLVFAMRECHISEVKIGENYLVLKDYKNKTMGFKRTINKQGEEIIMQQEALIDRDKTIKKELLKNSELQEMNRQIKIQSGFNKGNFTAKYIYDTIYHTDTVMNYIPVGTRFLKDEQWFLVSGEVGVEGIDFDSIMFKNELTLTLGYKKKKLRDIFKEKPLVIEGVNTNPYITTTGMQNISFKKPKKKWYETRAFAFGVGMLSGMIVEKL